MIIQVIYDTPEGVQTFVADGADEVNAFDRLQRAHLGGRPGFVMQEDGLLTYVPSSRVWMVSMDEEAEVETDGS